MNCGVFTSPGGTASTTPAGGAPAPSDFTARPPPVHSPRAPRPLGPQSRKPRPVHRAVHRQQLPGPEEAQTQQREHPQPQAPGNPTEKRQPEQRQRRPHQQDHHGRPCLQVGLQLGLPPHPGHRSRHQDPHTHQKPQPMSRRTGTRFTHATLIPSFTPPVDPNFGIPFHPAVRDTSLFSSVPPSTAAHTPHPYPVSFMRSVSVAHRLLLGGLTLLLGFAPPPPATPAAPPEALPSPSLHHLYRLSPRLFSGASPDDDEAFAELRKLGVTTIVSVDGARPNVEAARKHGLRYVHLPVGYDGISATRAAQLLKAAQTAPGALYVHCHHGKHRGPSAAALLGRFSAGWSTHQAVAWLQQAGTSPDYPGLYRTVAQCRPPDDATLASVSPLPKKSPPPRPLSMQWSPWTTTWII